MLWHHKWLPFHSVLYKFVFFRFPFSEWIFVSLQIFCWFIMLHSPIHIHFSWTANVVVIFNSSVNPYASRNCVLLVYLFDRTYILFANKLSVVLSELVQFCDTVMFTFSGSSEIMWKIFLVCPKISTESSSLITIHTVSCCSHWMEYLVLHFQLHNLLMIRYKRQCTQIMLCLYTHIINFYWPFYVFDLQLMEVIFPLLKHLSLENDVRPALYETFHMPEWFQKQGIPPMDEVL